MNGQYGPPPQRIPVPGPPPRDPRQEQAERARRRRAAEEARKEARVPSWGRDLLRSLSLVVFTQIFFGITIVLVRWRLLRSDSGQTVEDAQSWAAIVVLICGLMWPFLLLKPSRPDKGFRYSGLTALLVVGAVAAAACQVIAMLFWQFLIGPDLVAGSVLDQVGEDPVALITAAAVALCCYAFFAAVCVPMVAGGPAGALVCLIPFLGGIVGGAFAITPALESPPSSVTAFVWVGSAAVALVMLTSAALVISHLRGREKAHHGPARPVM